MHIRHQVRMSVCLFSLHALLSTDFFILYLKYLPFFIYLNSKMVTLLWILDPLSLFNLKQNFLIVLLWGFTTHESGSLILVPLSAVE